MDAYGMFFRRLFLRALKHIDDRELTITQLRVIMATKMCLVETPDKGVVLSRVAKNAGMSTTEVEMLLPELMALRYIHADIPVFGDRVTYRMGSVGGTFTNALRRAMQRGEEELECEFERELENTYAETHPVR